MDSFGVSDREEKGAQESKRKNPPKLKSSKEAKEETVERPLASMICLLKSETEKRNAVSVCGPALSSEGRVVGTVGSLRS